MGALAGTALAVWGVTLSVDAIDALTGGARIGDTRTPVPGQRTVALDTRKYVIYYEVDSGFAGGFDDAGDLRIPALQVAIRPEGGRAALPLDDYDGSFEVDSGGRSAEAWRTVEVPREGNYRISTGPEVRAAAPAVVLGRPVSGRVTNLVLGVAATLAGLGLLAQMAAIAIGLRVRARTQPAPR